MTKRIIIRPKASQDLDNHCLQGLRKCGSELGTIVIGNGCRPNRDLPLRLPLGDGLYETIEFVSKDSIGSSLFLQVDRTVQQLRKAAANE
jgi:hypothetical protein